MSRERQRQRQSQRQRQTETVAGQTDPDPHSEKRDIEPVIVREFSKIPTPEMRGYNCDCCGKHGYLQQSVIQDAQKIGFLDVDRDIICTDCADKVTTSEKKDKNRCPVR